MTTHLDLTLSCFCGGAVDTGQQTCEPHRVLHLFTRCECGDTLGLEMRLFRVGTGRREERPRDWHLYGTGERTAKLQRLGMA